MPVWIRVGVTTPFLGVVVVGVWPMMEMQAYCIRIETHNHRIRVYPWTYYIELEPRACVAYVGTPLNELREKHSIWKPWGAVIPRHDEAPKLDSNIVVLCWLRIITILTVDVTAFFLNEIRHFIRMTTILLRFLIVSYLVAFCLESFTWLAFWF